MKDRWAVYAKTLHTREIREVNRFRYYKDAVWWCVEILEADNPHYKSRSLKQTVENLTTRRFGREAKLSIEKINSKHKDTE